MTRSKPGTTRAHACALGCLADPRLAGLTPGLMLRDGWAEGDPKAFPCCGAGGSRLLPDQDLTVTCDLAARLKRVRLLLGQEARAQTGVTPGDAVPLAGADLTATLKRLALIASGESKRGLAFVTKAGERPPVAMASLAVTAAWRFGLAPHVVRAKRGSVPDLYPPKAVGRRILVVEGLGALWDPVEAEILDALVGYAYRSLTPLFLSLVFPGVDSEVPAPRPGASAGPRLTRSAFRAKIASYKSRSPLSWLSPDCLAKLPAVTDGLKSWGLTPTPRRGRTPAAPPKLPWDP